VVVKDGHRLLQLEDVARRYQRPCIMDVKLGFQTWYPGADPAHAQRCRAKDAATTQAAMGFRICGMQARKCLFDACSLELSGKTRSLLCCNVRASTQIC
jgi:hypothetical protein